MQNLMGKGILFKSERGGGSASYDLKTSFYFLQFQSTCTSIGSITFNNFRSLPRLNKGC
jgi:hypothetical protein